MMTLPPSVKIFVAKEPIDCRKGFDGLSIAVEHVLKQDPLSGHLFVFYNRRGDQVRILVWDRTGYWVHAKRLVCGVFRFAKVPQPGENHVNYDAADFALVLEGIDLRGAKRSKRWCLPNGDASK